MTKRSLPDSVLIESKSARDDKLASLTHEASSEVLNKVKALFFALWRGTELASTEQVADFYEVPTDNIRQLLKNHRDEFLGDGLKTLKGKDLKEVRDLLSLTSQSVNATTWTPRAALRLGMLLRDSMVAKQVRTALLDIVEYVVPDQAQEIEKLRLVVEIERERNKGKALDTTLVQVAGVTGALALRGRDDQIVEFEKPVLEVIDQQHNVRFKGQTLKQIVDYLKNRHGVCLFKTGAELKRFLEQVGQDDLVAQTKRSVISDYVPEENLEEVYKLVLRNSRQMFLGEAS